MKSREWKRPRSASSTRVCAISPRDRLGELATSAGGALGGSERNTAKADLASRLRLAPESVSAGTVGVQVFGVVDDDVASARVQVNGAWLPLRLARNGFYLDLPGVSYDQMGRFEATLRDGSTQIHDIRTATRIS